LAITIRAVSLVFSGMTPRKETRSAIKFTSASTVARNSGCSSIWRSPLRSNASFWMTWTTGVVKNSRMSPSHFATRGADPPRPPRLFFGASSPSP